MSVKRFVQKYVNLLDLRKEGWIAQDLFAKEPPSSSHVSKYPYVLGIMKEFWHMHWHYIAACRDLGVKYKVLDISGPDWQDAVRDSHCDAFLVRPLVQVSIWKQMYDERLKIIVDKGGVIFPSYEELWFWESKRRMHYWLEAHNIPHPKTHVFYDRDQARNNAETAGLPVVYKSDMGSSATGVIIFRDRNLLKKHINNVFKKGFTTYRRSPNDKEWGYIFLQEYVPNSREWRIIRIGDSYFGYEKLRVKDFHSGSHKWAYSRPPTTLLNVCREITDKNNFLSMAFDIFLTRDGQYLVNEMQTLFGMGNPYEMCVVDNKPGRMIYDEQTGNWVFEAGSFCQNYLDNLRVLTLLKILKERKMHHL